MAKVAETATRARVKGVPQRRAAVIEVVVNDVSTWALIDSGADRSMMSDSFARRVMGQNVIKPNHDYAMKGAGGEPLVITGQIDTPFLIQRVQFARPC